jgi:hypothetical protein
VLNGQIVPSVEAPSSCALGARQCFSRALNYFSEVNPFPCKFTEAADVAFCVFFHGCTGGRLSLRDNIFSPLLLITLQRLPHVRLRNSELSGNLRWLDTSLEGSADSIQLALRQTRRRLLARIFTGRLVYRELLAPSCVPLSEHRCKQSIKLIIVEVPERAR